MPKFSISGTAIDRVIKAQVSIVHTNPKAPDPIPVMQWDLTISLQHDDLIPKWALAQQSDDRFKKCELIVQNHKEKTAHTWTLLNAYVFTYEETEHPSAVGGEGEENYYLHLIVRGQILEATKYDGKNVMTVAKGEAPKLAS